MEKTYLSERQRQDLFRLATVGMVLTLLASNGGRYLSISPSVFVVAFSAVVLSWLTVTRREPDPAQIRLDRTGD